MSNKAVRVPVSTLQSFICDTFTSLGVPENEAQICSEVVITSDLRGIESHGIGRLKYYYDRIKSGQHIARTQVEIIRESPTTAVIDGHHGMGMITASRSMQMAIDKAKKYGMGAVAVRNSTHFGIAGYYPTMAARAGMIGMAFTNARPSIAPTFGVQPKLGTNPIALPVQQTSLFLSSLMLPHPLPNVENSRSTHEQRKRRRKDGLSTSREPWRPIPTRY
jgi:L-2-hydroxycarboxylate dehydrogenase (NAD+)